MPESHVEEQEPDYRFTLANERTYLAWIRTALGLLAGGVAVRQLVPDFAVPAVHVVLSLACVVLAACTAAGAFFHWRHVQQSMRRNKPLPPSRMVPSLAVGVGLTAVICAIAVITG